ncbi:MAG: hypothetical protein HFI88_02680 [Lachnospiraceae bacterium]|nr:hypothetical protein [Lachnospiraceae bacterium]
MQPFDLQADDYITKPFSIRLILKQVEALLLWGFSALAPDFVEETAVLTEGRHISDRDSKKILVSEQLAAASHLSVGSIITLTHAINVLTECAHRIGKCVIIVTHSGKLSHQADIVLRLQKV